MRRALFILGGLLPPLENDTCWQLSFEVGGSRGEQETRSFSFFNPLICELDDLDVHVRLIVLTIPGDR